MQTAKLCNAVININNFLDYIFGLKEKFGACFAMHPQAEYYTREEPTCALSGFSKLHLNSWNPFVSRDFYRLLNINKHSKIDHSDTGKSLSEALFFLQNMGRTCCVQNLFWMSKPISVNNMFSPGLSLEFSCIELVIQWTICCHIVG